MQITKVFLICLLFISPAFADEGVYNTNLANKDVSWWTVLSTKKKPFVEGVGVVSKGPFLIDENHRESSLIVGPLAVLMNGHGDVDYNGAIGRVDYTGTVVQLRLKMEGKYPKGGRTVFWFQARLSREAHAGNGAEMPPRYVNYYYNRDIQSEALSGMTVEIPMKPDLNDWTCLSRNPIDGRPLIGSAAKYTCAINQAEFTEAMSKPISSGIWFLLPDDGTRWLKPNLRLTPIMDDTSFALISFTIRR